MRPAISIFISGAFAVAAYCAPAHEVTYDQAHALVSLAFEHQVRHIKHRGTFFLYRDPANRPNFDERFYDFDVDGNGWAPPGVEEEGILGRFAVNKLTGEVWDNYAECWIVRFTALKANNFFGLHGGANAPFADDDWYTKDGVPMSHFPSYLDSAKSFAARYGKYVAGISDPTAFAQALVKAGFNSGKAPGGDPKFVEKTVGTIASVARRMK
ncbi:MAG: hypothetical protein WCA78_08925 [Rhizomicrobium sp.]